MDESWDNLSSIWSSTEEILYIISNARGETPRDGVLLYAKPYSGQLEKLLSSGSINLEDEESLGIFLKKTQLQSRFFSINFDNIGKAKNTIEIRLPNGTVDAETWIQNINLFGGIVKAAEALGFEAKAVNGNRKAFLSGFSTPAIAHVTLKNHFQHYIVVHKVTKKYILIADPRSGLEKYTYDDFFDIWSRNSFVNFG